MRVHARVRSRDEQEVIDVRTVLSNHRAILYAAYAHYTGEGASEHAMRAHVESRHGSRDGAGGASIGARMRDATGDDHARLGYGALVQLLKDCDVLNESSCSLDVVEGHFRWATRDDTPPHVLAKLYADIEPTAPVETVVEQVVRSRWSVVGSGGGGGGGGAGGGGGDAGGGRASPSDPSSASAAAAAAAEGASGAAGDSAGMAAGGANGGSSTTPPLRRRSLAREALPSWAEGLPPQGSLYRYQFLQLLIKLAIARYVGVETEETAEALEKLLADKVAPRLRAEARVDANAVRDSTLYTLEVEAVLRAQLPSLLSLFEAYATPGPTGAADLLALPAWLDVLQQLRLYDTDFTPREAVFAFLHSGMRVVDEVKARHKLLHLTLLDFCEALVRVALVKKLPTPDLLRKAGKPSTPQGAGIYYLELVSAPSPSVYEGFLQAHIDQGIISNNPIGMPPPKAVDYLLAVIAAVVRGPANGAPAGAELTQDEVAAFKSRVDDE